MSAQEVEWSRISLHPVGHCADCEAEFGPRRSTPDLLRAIKSHVRLTGHMVEVDKVEHSKYWLRIE